MNRSGIPIIDRRSFLKLGAASLALASAGCQPPAERILPFARGPEFMPPGDPVFYASAMTLGGFASGVLVETNAGRPTKIEGNPDHPASLGATDVHAQAAVLGLWDPERSRTPRRGATIASQSAFDSELRAAIDTLGDGGAGLFILAPPDASPTLDRQRRELARRFPAARWHCWDPLHRDTELAGTSAAFGRPLRPIYRLQQADVLVGLEPDLLDGAPGHLAHARRFADRRARGGADRGNRLYAIESSLTLAGLVAEHRIALSPARQEAWLGGLATALGVAIAGAPEPDDRARALARDLVAHRGRCLLAPGQRASAPIHQLAHVLNAALQAPGRTLDYAEWPAGMDTSCGESMTSLVDAMRSGAVRVLAILGGNPAYDAPADLGFAAALDAVPFSVHLSLHRDETSRRTTWHLPAAHFLEHWSDARAFDGSASLVQPTIRPLYGGRSAHELIAALIGDAHPDGYREVRATWRQRWGSADFEQRWSDALRRGIVDGSAARTVSAQARAPANWRVDAGPALTIAFRADASVRGGEFANNAWLQELPRPDTKFTWDNALILSPEDAQTLGVDAGDLVEVAAGPRGAARLLVPAWVEASQAPGAATISLGYGRTAAGAVGSGVGVDAYVLRHAGSPWAASPATVTRSAGRHVFALAQHERDAHGREPVRHAPLAGFLAAPAMFHDETPASIYPEWRYDDYRWGMSIDLNACTVACQAENNIPTVGREEVARGRIMHWIRVDRYDVVEHGEPRALVQPVPCMHCEHAPCEEVCPVGASIHDSEGLNVQVYNRCIGTRFCSQNCPYKVRRFNFLKYADEDSATLAAGRNPEVSVRTRGVMEKCTYCVQRITRARIAARREGRRIEDGEVVTACEAACPTAAIRFGDLNDPASRVNAVKASPLDYALLGELNTRPRTTYLARLVNRNPAWPEG